VENHIKTEYFYSILKNLFLPWRHDPLLCSYTLIVQIDTLIVKINTTIKFGESATGCLHCGFG
jgi:hypothetical protein